MIVRKVGEFDTKAKALQYVGDLAVESHRLAVGCRYMQTYLLADGNLRDRIDVASAGADVADPGRAFAGREFKFDFFEVGVAVLFSWHIF